MIKTIPLKITGETWYNPQEFRDNLANVDDEYVIIDVNSEGPALAPFGIYGLLAQHQRKYIFTKWSNPLESHPYGKVSCSERSHFFTLSWRYWIEEIKNNNARYPMGVFVGRNSIARNYILYDVFHSWPGKFLLSKMAVTNVDIWEERAPNEIIKIDNLKNWTQDQQSIRDWWATDPITSIDDKHVRDQYGAPEVNAANCILSLLSNYDQFNVELIAETYTLGTTFFPTEKTIRPIVGNKPFVVYGPINYLKNLQNLGFKTFGGIWNEQYDNYEGADRWRAMRPIISMICNWDNSTRQAVMTQCASITAHNRARLKEIIDDSKRV